MELKDIKKVIQMMKDNDLTEFLLEDDSCTLQMKRGAGEAPQVIAAAPQMVAAPAALAPAPAPAAPAAAPQPAADPVSDENAGLVEVPSPMVGTFYTAPTPEAEPFVQVGSQVTADTVVCIVEAMKVMNEIKAEMSGTIKKMLVDNASPIQYGQPLFLVDPS